MSSTISFNGGPFDGDQQFTGECNDADEHGCVRSSELPGMYPRWCVYLPNGRGGVVFDSWAPSLEAALARLPRKGAT